MPQRDSDSDPQEQMGGREIADSIHRAQAAMNSYDLTRKQIAMSNADPDGSAKLVNELVTLDSAVQDAYSKLRKYIKNEAEEDWWNSRIVGFEESGVPIVLGGREGETITIDDEEIDIQAEKVPTDSVRFIEDYQGEVVKREYEEWSRFDGWTTKERVEPALMPAAAYRRTIQYLEEIRNELGFSPDAKQPTNNTEITEEMIDDVTAWAEANL